MRIAVGMADLYDAIKDAEAGLARDLTAAMREATPGTKQELREQMVSAGLGARLANSWRDKVYPVGKVSLEPAGFVHSGAPEIVDSFLRGSTIRPVNGAHYLWIPTDNVPRARKRLGRGGKGLRGGAMTPDEVESHFNAEFTVRPGRNGTLLAFMEVTRGLNRRGSAQPRRRFRQNTAGRRSQGRSAEPILMFVLRKSVTMPKLLDLGAPAERWADRFTAALARQRG